jgi:hypothetical protein
VNCQVLHHKELGTSKYFVQQVLPYAIVVLVQESM